MIFYYKRKKKEGKPITNKKNQFKRASGNRKGIRKKWHISSFPLTFSNTVDSTIKRDISILDSINFPGTSSFCRTNKVPSLINTYTISWAESNPYGKHFTVVFRYILLFADFFKPLDESLIKKSFVKSYSKEISSYLSKEKVHSRSHQFLEAGSVESTLYWYIRIHNYISVKNCSKELALFQKRVALFPILTPMITSIPLSNFTTIVNSKVIPSIPKDHKDYTTLSLSLTYIKEIIRSISLVAPNALKTSTIKLFHTRITHTLPKVFYNSRTSKEVYKLDRNKRRKNNIDSSIYNKTLWEYSRTRMEIRSHSVGITNTLLINSMKTYVPSPLASPPVSKEVTPPYVPMFLGSTMGRLPKFSISWDFYITTCSYTAFVEPKVNEIGLIPVVFEQLNHTLDISILANNVVEGVNTVDQVVYNLNSWLKSLPSPIIMYNSYGRWANGQIVTEIYPSDLYIRLSGKEKVNERSIIALSILSDFLSQDIDEMRTSYRSRKGSSSQDTNMLPKSELITSLTVRCESKELFVGGAYTRSVC